MEESIIRSSSPRLLQGWTGKGKCLIRAMHNEGLANVVGVAQLQLAVMRYKVGSDNMTFTIEKREVEGAKTV